MIKRDYSIKVANMITNYQPFKKAMQNQTIKNKGKKKNYSMIRNAKT
jgi:hypothetical protein